MNKFIITACAAIAFIFPTLSNAQQFIYKSPNENIQLFVEQNIAGTYVKKIIIKNNKCSITQYAGPTKGKVNENISVNFALFGWDNNAASVNGVLANSSVVSYAKSSVSWTRLEDKKCAIAPGKATLPIVSQS